MRRYESREIDCARAYAAAGGQALHVMRHGWPTGPACFRRAREIGHLFDQDADRLRATARRLGVRQVAVHHAGTVDQHVDLCGRPLQRASAEAGT